MSDPQEAMRRLAEVIEGERTAFTTPGNFDGLNKLAVETGDAEIIGWFAEALSEGNGTLGPIRGVRTKVLAKLTGK